MKVYIGPYKSWLCVYRMVDCLSVFGISEETCDKIGEWVIDYTPIQKIFDRINERRDRTVKVRIDDWDTWSADNTLSTIVHPLLEKLAEDNRGVPVIDLEDVPESLRYVVGTDSGENDWDRKSIFWMEQRWKWVLGEMIFAHKNVVDDRWADQFHHGNREIEWKEIDSSDGGEKFYEMLRHKDYYFDKDGYEKYNKRIDNGLRLFGKYYRNLWI
jgi:hypothetical protein